MARYGDITMSLGELNRLKTVQAVIDGNLKPGRATDQLGPMTPLGVEHIALRLVN